MRLASAISEDLDTVAAVREAARVVVDALAAPADLAMVFASSDHSAAFDDLPSLLMEELPGALVVGCSGQSVLGSGREIEDRPGLALLAASLPDVRLVGFHVEPGAEYDEDELSRRIGFAPSSEPSFVLPGDPLTADVEAVLAALGAGFPGAPIVGALASGQDPSPHRLFLGDRTLEHGIVGVGLEGDVVLDTVVAQGCRPVGSPMFVTHCRDQVLHAVDGRVPFEVLNELFAAATPDEQELYQTALFLGIEMRPEQVEYGAGDFLVRNVVGGDPENGSLVVGAPLETTQVVQFHLRDAAAAAEDLDRQLRRHAASHPPAAGALLFSCLGRGEALFGEPHHDSAALRRHLGDLPVAGFFANGEIGPVEQRPFLHSYTSAFGLLRPRSRS